jgi:transmembrane sensor
MEHRMREGIMSFRTTVTTSSHVMGSRSPTEQAELAASRFIAQRETGPWSEADSEAFQTWLHESPLHRVIYFRLHAAWQEAGRLTALKPTPDVASRTAPRYRPTALLNALAWRLRTIRPLAWTVAVCAVLLMTTGVAGYYRFIAGRYVTGIGDFRTVALADGSQLTLNTDSAVRVSLAPHERRIDLDRGEVYFAVAHDTNRPFVVYVGSKRVIAVGTQFAIRRQDNAIQVAVTEGTVRLEEQSPFESAKHTAAPVPGGTATPAQLLLPAGSVARAESGSVLVQKETLPQLAQTLSWRTGLLTFQDTPLAAAVAEFNRYNSRKLVLGDSRVGSLQVGGIFGATKIDTFVRLLEGGFPIQAQEEGNAIVLRMR